MIIWVNGTFGAGKSSTSAALAPLLTGSRVFDPETVGFLLRDHLSDLPVADFQDWPAWRTLVAATAGAIARQTGALLIAPQTVLHRSYLDEIFQGLGDRGLRVFHVLLDADDEVLRGRIAAVEEARDWRLSHLADYARARPWLRAAADLVVDTGERSIVETADDIAAALPSST